MKIAILSSLFVFTLFFTSCIKPNEPIIEAPGQNILNGEITPSPETRAVIVDGTLKYDWSKTPEKPMQVYYRNAAGTKQATYNVTLKINSDGHSTFSVALPAWYPQEETWIAGAIDVTAGTSAPRFNLAQPTTINVDANTDYYLPMYFPLTKVVNVDNNSAKVSTLFNTFGSMLRVEVTNNLPITYEVKTHDLRTSMVRLKGTMDWTGKTLGQAPGWTTSSSARSDTITNFTINNMILSPGATKTFYVWVKQEANNQNPFIANVRALNGVNPSVTLRPAPSDSLKNNRFYRIALPLSPELMITEVFEGPATNSCLIELYNPGTTPIELSNYYIWESVYRQASVKLPTYSLPGGGLVVLATPASVTAGELSYVQNNTPTLTMSANSSDRLGDPFSFSFRFALRKFSDVSQYLTVDSINFSPWGGNNGSASRASTINMPQVTFNAAQWTRTTYQASKLGIR